MYDVALSFAGEDRTYVEKVAEKLRDIGIKVFYDDYEKSDLWGKNLYEHFSIVYKDKSRYVVMFISKHYAEKAWPSHERRNAQAKAINQNFEYILPARFDDTPIPGMLDTTAYIDLSITEPGEFANLIVDKVRNSDYWVRELGEASDFSKRVLYEAHRGAFLWRKDITAIFDNRVADIDEPYLVHTLWRLNGINILAQSRQGDHPIVFLLDTDQAREVNKKVWISYENIYLSQHSIEQRKIARGVIGTVLYKPVRGPEK